MSVQVVWFKRDLRLRDHRPLAQAAQRGPVVCLYIYEPELLHHREFDTSRLVFINESLAQLEESISDLGGTVTYRVGDAVSVLDELHTETAFNNLWAHEETGSYRTYQRDIAVRDWARESGVTFREIPQNGVIRGLETRDGWAARWNKRMNQPRAEVPDQIRPVTTIDHERRRTHDELDLPPSQKSEALPGGERQALYVLDSFLNRRGKYYRTEMSSPVTAWESCSRLSPYLAHGNISMKTVWQRTLHQEQRLREREDEWNDVDGTWFQALSSFKSRLHWHCHFMQKLEDAPRIEFENFAYTYNGLRENEFNEDYFEAWKRGKTGFPMIDATMRALHESGWINFRMRAMIVSFASYHLWLHWRETGQYLAQHFLDFEPGIHWSQMQMQSGTTGINTPRIYNPTKQAEDHDPNGEFIRNYVPELEDVPDEYICRPFDMPTKVQRAFGCRIGEDYPEPIVDGQKAWKEASERIWAVKNSTEAKREAKKIRKKHGSRKSL